VDAGGVSASLIADRSRFSAKQGDTRVRFLPRIDRRDRLVSYSLEIKNIPSGAVVRRYEGIAVLPAALAWDGRDETGAFAADGDYTASLSVLFEGGERTAAESSSYRSIRPLLMRHWRSIGRFSLRMGMASWTALISRSATRRARTFGPVSFSMPGRGRSVFLLEERTSRGAILGWPG
jgi:hypothetical protein